MLDDQPFILFLEIIGKKRLVNEVKPFDERFAKLLRNVFNKLFAYARAEDGFLKVATHDAALFAVERQRQLFLVFRHYDGC